MSTIFIENDMSPLLDMSTETKLTTENAMSTILDMSTSENDMSKILDTSTEMICRQKSDVDNIR